MIICYLRSMGHLLQPSRLKYWLLAATALHLVLVQVLRRSEAVEFSFPPYPALFRPESVLSCTGWNQTYVHQDQWCRIRPDGNSFELTPTSGSGDNTFNTSSRLMYSKPIRFYDSSTGKAASFSTFFIFHISKQKATFELGSGMTFLIAPSYSTPEGSFGGELGLFDGQTDTTGNPKFGPSRIVAVEIDTYKRGPWDFGPAPHLGLDIDSVHSVNASYLWNATVFVQQHIAVWVDYDAPSQYLEVRVMNVTDLKAVKKKDGVVWLTYSGLNLSALVNEFSFVGFSAAAASDAENRGEVHEIFNWTFSTNGLDEGSSGGMGTRLVAGLSAGGVFVLVLVAAVIWRLWCGRKRKSKKARPRFSTSLESMCFTGVEGPREFSYQELKVATSNFSPENVLGEGGFGKVHKGVLADKSPVAIKRSAEHSRQGEREFVAEVTTIGRLRHRNLVPLKGWCRTEDELLLVYEFMPNGSLFSHLFQPKYGSSDDDDHESGSTLVTPLSTPPEQIAVLNWDHRYRILQGVASALHYLHAQWEEQTIIHRDVKSSNVMLDANWNGRLGDFGLARLVKRNSTAATVTRTAGTRGYLAPECVYRDKVGAESDVFSFGVMAMEVVSGRKPIDWLRPAEERFLVNWIWTLNKEGRLLDAVDPQLAGEYDAGQVTTALRVGLLCCAEEPTQRPTMAQVTQYFITAKVEMPSSPKWMPPLNYRSGAIFSGDARVSAGSSSSRGVSRSSEATTSSIHGFDISLAALLREIEANRPHTVLDTTRSE